MPIYEKSIGTSYRFFGILTSQKFSRSILRPIFNSCTLIWPKTYKNPAKLRPIPYLIVFLTNWKKREVYICRPLSPFFTQGQAQASKNVHPHVQTGMCDTYTTFPATCRGETCYVPRTDPYDIARASRSLVIRVLVRLKKSKYVPRVSNVALCVSDGFYLFA